MKIHYKEADVRFIALDTVSVRKLKNHHWKKEFFQHQSDKEQEPTQSFEDLIDQANQIETKRRPG